MFSHCLQQEDAEKALKANHMNIESAIGKFEKKTKLNSASAITMEQVIKTLNKTLQSVQCNRP